MRPGFIARASYVKIISRIAMPCVDLVITEGSSRRFLLVLRKDEPMKGYFWFPGGRIFKGEHIFATAIRKAKEELGVVIKPERIVGVYETMFSTGIPGVRGGTHALNIVVRARLPRGGVMRHDTHHLAARWFTRPPRDFQGYLAQVLKDALVLRSALKRSIL